MNLPKLYGLVLGSSEILNTMSAVKWLLVSVFSMLAIGFVLLYRKSALTTVSTSSTEETPAKKATKNARGRS